MTEKLTAEQAESLESAFLGGLEEAQFAYERIVEHEAWLLLGFERFASWWDARVTPTMRALSMRPTREIAQAVVEQVRKEEAELPPAQRRRDYELAEMVGATPDEIRNRTSRSTSTGIPTKVDVGVADAAEPKPVELPKHQEHADASLAAIDEAGAAAASVASVMDRVLPPDTEGPKIRWRINFLGAIQPCRRLLAQFKPEQVVESADEECLDELARLADDITSYLGRVRAARPVPENVRHLRAVS